MKLALLFFFSLGPFVYSILITEMETSVSVNELVKEKVLIGISLEDSFVSFKPVKLRFHKFYNSEGLSAKGAVYLFI